MTEKQHLPRSRRARLTATTRSTGPASWTAISLLMATATSLSALVVVALMIVPVVQVEAFLTPSYVYDCRQRQPLALKFPDPSFYTTTTTTTTGLRSGNTEDDQGQDKALSSSSSSSSPSSEQKEKQQKKKQQKQPKKKKKVVIIGAGWGGLSTAHALSTQMDVPLDITVIDASPKVGGLVRDGFQTLKGKINKAEAGQHGFWDNYHNIFALLDKGLPNSKVDLDEVLTGYAEQGQYSPNGLEAVWPVYRQQSPQLPTGLAQALYTKFKKLPPLDRVSAAPLVLAFSEFDDSPEAWEKYDQISFRDLCIKLGVSRRCYDEAFEPMILTGLFAPGAECSAAAALGMAYFFVLKSQNSFDVRWCKGNIGEKIFQPWVEHMENNNKNDGNANDANGGDDNGEERQTVKFMTSTRVVGFEKEEDDDDDVDTTISKVLCKTNDGEDVTIESADAVVFAVGGAALNNFVKYSPVLAQHAEFRRFANLRGTGVLATRLYLDKFVDTPYSANACWGFDEGVGMTFFDITKLHGLVGDGDRDSNSNSNSDDAPTGSIIEVDYYHAASLLVMDDEAIVEKAKRDLDTMLGNQCETAEVVDAAVVKLPQAVNWYSPGSYKNMPDVQSKLIPNVYFAGDLVRTRHGSWSQEKAYVSGIEAANAILQRRPTEDIIPLEADELHVALGRTAITTFKTVLGRGDPSKAPSLLDFIR